MTQTFDKTRRTRAPIRSDEVTALRGFLDYHRDTLRWKSSGLSREQLAEHLPPSTMTIGGMMKHLSLNEVGWFGQTMGGEPYPPPFADIDWDADPDWEWRTAAGDSPEELLSLWRDAVARSRAAVRDALAGTGPERIAHHTNARGESPSLRRLLVDMIEEYARHVGHADLIRESVDGLTGEDPPL
jgi:hypothetical protein